MCIVGSIFFACSASQKTTAKKECLNRLEDFTKTNWNYSSSKGYYEITDSFKKAIESYQFPCVRGKDTTYILDLFGRERYEITDDFPHGWRDTISGAIQYLTSASLNEKMKVGKSGTEHSVRAYFNDKGKVLKIVPSEVSFNKSH